MTLHFVNSAEDKNCELSLKSVELKALTPLDAHVIPRRNATDAQRQTGKPWKTNSAKTFCPAQSDDFYAILAEGINNGRNLYSRKKTR